MKFINHIIESYILPLFNLRQFVSILFINFFLFVILFISLLRSLQVSKDIGDVIGPFHRSISHAEIDLGLLFHLCISSLFSYLHGSVEVFGARVIVPFLNQQFTQLQIRTTLALPVLQLIRQL